MENKKISEILLKVENLKVTFFTQGKLLKAVKGVSFNLYKDEILGIVGESGSGKSVTSHSIINLLPKNSRIEGKIFFENKNIFELSSEELRAIRGKKIGMIFQEPSRSFDPIYNIEKTFYETFLAHNPKMSKSEIYQRTVKLLEEVKIPQPKERLKNFPHQFSGGMLQRIMIALALALDPEILIADEPTTALDVTIQAEIINLILNIKKSRNLSVIFITHNLPLLKNIVDRVIVMYNGLIMESGKTKQIFEKPFHPYTKELIESIPFFGMHYQSHSLKAINGNPPDPLKEVSGCPFYERCKFRIEKCLKELPEITVRTKEIEKTELEKTESVEFSEKSEYRCFRNIYNCEDLDANC